MAWLTERKVAHRERKQNQRAVAAMAPLARAWDESMLRSGDHVKQPSDAGRHASEHPEKWDPMFVLTLAWRSIGRSLNPRSGVQGQHRQLSIVSTVASALSRVQRRWFADTIRHVQSTRRIPFVFRHYDATPGRFRFGALQDVLADVARYAVKDPHHDGRWLSVPYSTYRSMRPNSRNTRFGIL